ncbi:hypothetical protein V6Z77_004560 [Aspergillus fumigatus]
MYLPIYPSGQTQMTKRSPQLASLFQAAQANKPEDAETGLPQTAPPGPFMQQMKLGSDKYVLRVPGFGGLDFSKQPFL